MLFKVVLCPVAARFARGRNVGLASFRIHGGMAMFEVNWVAILVLAVFRNALGTLWYSPVLFEGTWCRLNGVTPARMREGLPRNIAVELVGNVILAMALSWVVRLAGVTGIGAGAAIGVLAWFGFVATTSIADVTWAKRPVLLWLIDNGVRVIGFAVMGAVLAIWR